MLANNALITKLQEDCKELLGYLEQPNKYRLVGALQSLKDLASKVPQLERDPLVSEALEEIHRATSCTQHLDTQVLEDEDVAV